jgi:hypothetical protein
VVQGRYPLYSLDAGMIAPTAYERLAWGSALVGVGGLGLHPRYRFDCFVIAVVIVVFFLVRNRRGHQQDPIMDAASDNTAGPVSGVLLGRGQRRLSVRAESLS